MTKMSQVSMSSSKQPPRRGNMMSASSTSFRYFFIGAIVALGLVMVFSGSAKSASEQQGQEINPAGEVLSVSRQAEQRSTTNLLGLPSNEIIQGSWNGEAYYHCPANKANLGNKKVQDLVLWHGAKFTKKEWKTSGILQKLCNIDHFSVTALDLSHRSNHEALVKLLHGLQDDEKLLTLPLAAIVTPSASGFGVVDWINQATADFRRSVQLWVPVACPAVLQLEEDKMEELRRLKFPVLAIYGDLDVPAGRDRSNLLGDKMDAEVVEIKGRHPCYLDSPDAFIETLTKRLENERLKNSQ